LQASPFCISSAVAAACGHREGGTIMRMMTSVLLTVMAAGAATFAGSAPAAAYDYPWCAQGRGVGIPGDCSYQTYAQCMASASGRALYCNVNPRVAFGQQRRGRGYRNYYND
jgi:hypothetical protein